MKSRALSIILACLTMRANCEPTCKEMDREDKKAFNLAMMGYDPGFANPLSKTGDPGFRTGRIFDHACMIGNKVGYYDFITVASDYNCQSQVRAETIRTFDEYIQQRSDYMVDSERQDASHESGGDIFFAQFSATSAFNKAMKYSSESEELRESFQEQKVEVITAKADCYTHDVMMAHIYSRPKFSNDFIQALKRLDSLINSTGHFEIEETIGHFSDFTKKFGTHFLSKTQYGSSIVVEQISTDRSLSSSQASKRKSCFEFSVESCLGYSLSVILLGEVKSNNCFLDQMAECTEENSASSSDNINIESTINIISKGSRPSSLDEWALANYNPIPLKLTLTPLIELLRDENVSNDTAYGFDKSLNAAGIKQLIAENHIYGYCTKVLGFTEEQCADLLEASKGCGLNDNCAIDEFCINNPRFQSGFECFEICPKGWQKYPNGRCSIFVKDKKSHTEASNSCMEDYDGILAEPVMNLEQNNLLLTYPVDEYWLGITRDERTNSWSYLNNGTAVLGKWKDMEPNMEGNCVKMSTGQWQRQPCDSTNSYVCVHSPGKRSSSQNFVANNMGKKVLPL